MRIFLKESVDVSRPLEAVWARLLGGTGWFARLATEAEADSEEVYFQVGPPWAGGQITREVRVKLGQPYSRAMAIVLPLSWEASKWPRLFPVLEGELEVASIDTESIRVTLSASYTPPLGEVGRQLDQLLLHGLASSTARNFLDRVADDLEESTVVRNSRARSGWAVSHRLRTLPNAEQVRSNPGSA